MYKSETLKEDASVRAAEFLIKIDNAVQGSKSFSEIANKIMDAASAVLEKAMISVDDSLDMSNAAGQYRKDVAQRAFARWIMEYAVVNTKSKAEAMELARGIVRELGFEAEAFINKLDFDKVE